MTPSRFARLSQGLNGVARKVLEAVPIQNAWTAVQINAELHRVGARMDHQTLEGCLERLRRVKLISEPAPGVFSRVPIRVSDRIDPDELDEEDTMANAIPAASVAPFDKLAQLTQQMRELAKALEDVALEIQAEIEREQRKTEKLRQLQAALKELV